MKNTNNELMLKAQTILFSNQDMLEALVDALETVSLKAIPEQEVDEKIEYKVTEKDVGSLCYFSDYPIGEHVDNYINNLSLLMSSDDDYTHYEDINDTWTYCKPYYGYVKLHFKPHLSHEKTIKDLGHYFALLWGDGGITFYNKQIQLIPNLSPTKINPPENELTDYIVGYCNLSFVNTVLEE